MEPDSDLARMATATVAETWGKFDSVALSDWITKLPPGETTDLAITGLLKSIVEDDPERARPWAESLKDEKRRNEWLQKLNES
jgi:hypothetical protein